MVSSYCRISIIFSYIQSLRSALASMSWPPVVTSQDVNTCRWCARARQRAAAGRSRRRARRRLHGRRRARGDRCGRRRVRGDRCDMCRASSVAIRDMVRPDNEASNSPQTLKASRPPQVRHSLCNCAGMTTIGLIANPVSARDIRRIIAKASNLQIADRVNIVLRVLTAAHSLGVERVLVMPDNGGIRALLMRHLARGHSQHQQWPLVEFLGMAPTSKVDDTFEAARLLRVAGVAAIVVLGGDGTHRAAVRECRSIPIAGISTGTNNAFPEMRESTITGIAVALYATGRLSAAQALAPNKLLEVSINEGAQRDIALVDAVISTDRYIGARALWKPESLSAVYLSFADPQAIGLSAVGGLLK